MKWVSPSKRVGTTSFRRAAGSCGAAAFLKGWLVFLAIEEVFGFVINPSFVADIEAGRRGSKATDGVNALDESGSVEDTGSAGGDAGEQKPWDGSRINGDASDLRTD